MAKHSIRRSREAADNDLYRIVVVGDLHESWSEWLGRIELDRKEKMVQTSHTILLSEVPDQAALRGLLNRIWDLNLEIIALQKIGNEHNGGTNE